MGGGLNDKPADLSPRRKGENHEQKRGTVLACCFDYALRHWLRIAVFSCRYGNGGAISVSTATPTASQEPRATVIKTDPTATPTVGPPAPNTPYVVRGEDTLYSLARRYGTSVQELTRLNDIPNPSLIYVGQPLRIPSSDSTFRASTVQSRFVVHIVARGDTLYSVARGYETTVEEIVAVNSIPVPSYIRVGERLVIPQNVTYVVQERDTLYSIARRYGTTVNEIIGQNGVQNPSLIYVGQQLVIPAMGGVEGDSN